MTITRSSLHTLSACLRQSILLIFPFWSAFETTQIPARWPLIWTTTILIEMQLLPLSSLVTSSLYLFDVSLTAATNRSLWVGVMSFLNLLRSRAAHFCFTSTFSACNTTTLTYPLTCFRFSARKVTVHSADSDMCAQEREMWKRILQSQTETELGKTALVA